MKLHSKIYVSLMFFFLACSLNVYAAPLYWTFHLPSNITNAVLSQACTKISWTNNGYIISCKRGTAESDLTIYSGDKHWDIYITSAVIEANDKVLLKYKPQNQPQNQLARCDINKNNTVQCDPQGYMNSREDTPSPTTHYAQPIYLTNLN